MQLAQKIAEHTCFTKTLERIINAHEYAVTHKCKYDRVRMHWPYPAKGCLGDSEIKCRIHQLKCYQYPGQHTHYAPQHSSVSKPFHDPVIVKEFISLHRCGCL